MNCGMGSSKNRKPSNWEKSIAARPARGGHAGCILSRSTAAQLAAAEGRTNGPRRAKELTMRARSHAVAAGLLLVASLVASRPARADALPPTGLYTAELANLEPGFSRFTTV